LRAAGRGQDVTKGRRRDQGAVKISCARQDPNARNCHGYRKFVKKSVLEDPQRGLLLNDTLVIRYQIELVVSTGGALSRHSAAGKAVSQSGGGAVGFRRLGIAAVGQGLADPAVLCCDVL
jgi:speckle-type POZ protein